MPNHSNINYSTLRPMHLLSCAFAIAIVLIACVLGSPDSGVAAISHIPSIASATPIVFVEASCQLRSPDSV